MVAVDPSSAFTGGAILGDRIRMEEAIGETDSTCGAWRRAGVLEDWRARRLTFLR